LLATDVQVVGSQQEIHATSCTSDAEQVRPGDVYVALSGAESDGHDQAAEAVHRGAAAVICERLVPAFGVPQFIVSDGHVVYGRLCQALMGNPDKQLKVIGVTGTSGKTTVARLLESVLRAAGGTVGTIDSLGYGSVDNRRRAPDADLSPPALAHSLAHMVADGCSHAVVELSSRELSRSVLAGVELDVACLTNVGRDHLDWHSTLENYRRAKRRIFDHLAATGIAILNADDPESARILSELDHPALSVGLRRPAEISAQIVEQHVNEQTFLLTAGDESVGVRTTMIGNHHVANCLTAAALGLVYRIDLMTIARGLEALEQLPGRMERIACGQEFTVLVDAARSTDALRASLRAARQVTSGRLICVYGPTGPTPHSELLPIGRVIGAMTDLAVVTSDSTPGGYAQLDSAELLRGAAELQHPQEITDRAAAVAWALDEARAGDTVIIAGLGDRPYDTPGADGQALDDREVARQLLRGATVPFRIAA
jgi:UDP-N-acetylmuramoyl-L-alanyl-D-glutamate--2,6-diaminopimelate ligase